MKAPRHPKRQPALFWLLVAFNLVMYVIVIPLRLF